MYMCGRTGMCRVRNSPSAEGTLVSYGAVMMDHPCTRIRLLGSLAPGSKISKTGGADV